MDERARRCRRENARRCPEHARGRHGLPSLRITLAWQVRVADQVYQESARRRATSHTFGVRRRPTRNARPPAPQARSTPTLRTYA